MACIKYLLHSAGVGRPTTDQVGGALNAMLKVLIFILSGSATL